MEKACEIGPSTAVYDFLFSCKEPHNFSKKTNAKSYQIFGKDAQIYHTKLISYLTKIASRQPTEW